MKRIAWAAPVAVGLTVGIPVAARATTTPTPTPNVGSAPAPAAAAKNTTGSAGANVKAADLTTTTPAPAGSAEAYALRVGSVAAVSHTQATASSTGTSSTADPVEIGGKPLATQFGGTQTGAGSSHGALLDTGPGQPLRLQVTPWTATNTQTASGSTASGVADILALDLGDPTTPMSASARVLQSKSDASWTPAASTGSASSDGAIVNLGGSSGLSLDVLHSETGTSGTGSSYLLSVNGNQIGSSQQANGACALGIPSLLTLNCLTASGGTAGGIDTVTAGVASATLGSGSNSLTADLVKSTGSSGQAPTAAPPAIAAGSSPAPATSPAQSGTAGSAGPGAPATASGAPSSGSLPFTGIDALGLIAAAMTLSSAGGLIVMASRRRVQPVA